MAIRATPKLIDFVKCYEAFKPEASPCVSGKRFPDGSLMYDIGYGCQQWEDGTRVQFGDTINSFEAEQLMATRLEEEFEPDVAEFMGPITFSQPMWDALVSAWYNLEGPRSQQVMVAIRNGEYGGHVEMTDALAERWVLYCNPNNPNVRKGLYRRRVGEVLIGLGLPDPYENSQTLEYKEPFWPLVDRLKAEIGVQDPVPAPEPEPPKPKPLPKEPVMADDGVIPEPVIPKPAPPAIPYGSVDPAADPKSMLSSKRFWGMLILVVSRFSFLGVASSTFLGELMGDPVLFDAATAGLAMGAIFLIDSGGQWLHWFGKKKATRTLV
ncbi:MAG: hypothetical protein AAGK02_09705 [Pseudomonadota bacterium]